ncbi:ABC transporter substrate-binding protein [Anaerosalibacter sp. Marseille-P3206]|uniref:ABC transporter substrate-binding protein n=1 Tax=Anaerosalibacter sp. Marseille-P3206 TaxID=1871005 RepID=UPI000985CBA5|nr:cobalamin-binding protein [Anaerosalibacter sp. Marseille-P3206]
MKNFRNKKVLLLLLALVLTLTVFTGCGNNKTEENLDSKGEKVEEEAKNSNYPMEVEDQFGNTVTFEKMPESIVSLAPSHTEILFSLGLEDKIVGVTEFCDYPEEAKTKEKVGSFTGVNIEKIIELNPDLVVEYGPGDEEVNKSLREAGINVLCYEPESIDSVIDVIEKLGEITDTTGQAETVVNEMNNKKEEIVNKVKDSEKVKVFYEIWHDPLMAAGPGSFMDELINLAGGENIAADAEGDYPQFDLEQLIERDPEVYLAAEDSEEKTVESIKTRPGFENISAVKNGKVYLLEPNIVSRPGPRIVEALEMVAKAIHPELFK